MQQTPKDSILAEKKCTTRRQIIVLLTRRYLDLTCNDGLAFVGVQIRRCKGGEIALDNSNKILKLQKQGKTVISKLFGLPLKVKKRESGDLVMT